MSVTSRPVAIVKALAALAAAGLFLAGIPLLLWQFVGNPLPTVIPSWDDFSHAITTGEIDSWTWVKIVACVAWAAWAQLAASFLVEIAAAIRGGTAAAIRGLGATQWIAARTVAHITLITSITLQSTAGVAAAAAPLPIAPSADSVTGPDVSAMLTVGTLTQTGQGLGLVLVADANDNVSVGAEIEVERRGTLWSLAEQHLGDGERWEQIRDANVGRTMGDGVTLSHDFTVLRQGWSLVIPGLVADPAPATSDDAASSSLETGHDTATGRLIVGSWQIAEGDHFWRIADTVLSEAYGRAATDAEIAPYWGDLVSANLEHLDSEDPDIVFVGEEFEVLLPTIPDSVDGTIDDLAGTHSLDGLEQFTPATRIAAGDGEARPDLSGLPATQEPEAQITEETPETEQSFETEDLDEPAGAPAATRQESESAQSDETPSSEVRVVDDASENPLDDSASGVSYLVETQTVALGALGTAVGGGLLLYLLRALRRFQGARRRPETMVEPAPEDAAAFESRIRPVADVEAVRWLVATNQYLSHKLGEAPGARLPAVVAMRAGVHGVEILLDDECPPVDGFVSADGRAWRLHPDLEVRQIEAEAAHAHPYCPALLPVGETDVGDLLLDFEQLDTISLTGVDDTILGWLRSLAIGVTSTPWSQECEVVAIGVDDALDRIDQVTVPADPHAWAERTATVMTATAKRLSVSPYESRVNPGEIHHPMIVLIGPGHEGVAQLLAEVSSLAYAPVALIAAAPIADAYRLELLEDAGMLEPTGLDFCPTVTATEAVRLTTDLIAAASQTISIPTDQLLDVASPSTTEPEPPVALPTSDPDQVPANVGPEAAVPEWPVERPPLPDEPPPEDEFYGAPTDLDDYQPATEAQVAKIDLTDNPTGDGQANTPGVPLLADDDDDEPPSGPGGGAPQPETGTHTDEVERASEPAVSNANVAKPYAVPVGASVTPSGDVAARILAITSPKPVEVRVLGAKPEVSGLTEKPTAKIEAVITYLGFHRSALSERVRNEFWPSSVNRSTSDNAIAKIRRRLGTGADGEARLSLARNTGKYELTSDVGCDWDCFQQLITVSKTVSSPADQMATLEAALQLVTGEPTSDAPAKYYGWLRDDHVVYSEISGGITDAAHRLGDLALTHGVEDVELAMWAAAQGLLAQPDHEAMRRIQMRASSLAGDGKGVEDAYRRATAVAEAHSAFEEVQPETEELYAKLTRGRAVMGHPEHG